MKKSRTLWAVLLVVCMIAQLFVPMTASSTNQGTVTAEKLQVEYQTNPLGMDNPAPRFSWKLNSNVRGVTQESYRILVADSEAKLAGGPYVWDSGTVPSSDTFGVTYGGSSLAATTRYYWKVISTTNIGVAETADWWETGLMGSKIDSWDGAQWITKPTSVSNPDIDNYTLEWDFSMIKDGASVRFASAGSYYLVWQFNINPVEQSFGGTPYFRPHRWNTGGASMQNINVSNVIPDNEEGKHAWYHCKVVVTKSGSTYYATTYLGPVGGALTNIDNNRTLPTGHNWSLGKLGFRQFHDSRNVDDANFDNMVVTDNTGGADNVIYTETFDGPSVPTMFAGHGFIENGTYRLGKDGHEEFEGSYRVVDPEPAPGGDPLFRKDFTVTKAVKSARLYATARGYYEFSLNGRKVGDEYLAPGWTDYNYTLMYQTYDVTNMLNQGANAIGSMISQGWWSGPQQGATNSSVYGTTQSLLGKLVIEYEDGEKLTVVTDDSWNYHPGPIVYADNYAGEYYDARYDCNGWNNAGYTGTGWIPAAIHAPLAAKVNIVSQTGEAIREVARFTDPVVTQPVAGRYTFDFGQNMSGFLRLKVKGAAGSTITIKHAEMLNTDIAYKLDGQNAVKGGDGPPGTIYRANMRDSYARGRKVAIDTYTFKGDQAGEEWTPRFTFHGFRYAEITGISSLDDILEIEAIAISSDNELTTTFESSNSKVNQLYSNILWGMRGNFVSIPTDCPNRDERLGYTGDTQIFAGTGVYLANNDQFYSKWLRDLRDYQLNETSGDTYGKVPVIIPMNNWSGGWPTNWSSAWGNAAVIVPWQLYQQYGDKQIIKDAFESMKTWCDFQMHSSRTTNYIRTGNSTSQDNNYGDWLAVEGSDKSLTNTLYMAYDFRTFSIMARAIGQDAIADTYEDTCRKIVQAIMNKWGTADGNLNVSTQTPLALFLHFGLGDMTDKADKTVIAEKLMANVRDHGWTLTTGFIGVNALVPALSNNGQMEAALRLLEQENYPSWIYSINQGATTTWERWNSYTTTNGFGDPGMNSFNHYSYGAIGEWMFSGALGIHRDEESPGFRHFTLNPQYGGTLTYANGSYESVAGGIESGWTWNKETRKFEYKITIPANTSATVLVPAEDPAYVMENGIPAANAEGINYIGYDEDAGRAKYEIASGSYTFTSTVPSPPTYHNVAVKNTTIDVFAKITSTQKEKTSVTKIVTDSSATISLLEDKPFILNVEPYNNVDFTANTVTDDQGQPVSMPISGPGLAGDMSLSVSYTWIGHTNLLAGLSNANITVSNPHSETGTQWGKQNLVDGRLTTRDGRNGYTSANGVATAARTIAFNFGSQKSFNRIQIYPRTDAVAADGGTCGFPLDFELQVSNNGSTWTTISGQSYTNYTAPYLAPAVFEFPSTTAQYVRLNATRIGAPASDDNADPPYRLQLTEIGVYNVGLLNVTTGSLESGTVKTPYSQTLTADGSGVKWAVIAGSLPDGLFLNPATGEIFGTPAKDGVSTFTVKASNNTDEGTKQLSIAIVADKSLLEAAIADAEVYEGKEALYSAGSWESLQNAVKEAKRVYADEDATQKGVDTATDALNNAMANLVSLSAVIVDKDSHEPVEPQEVYMDAPFTVLVKTPADVMNLKFVNETGGSVSRTIVNKQQSGENEITWVIAMSVGTVGEGRTLRLHTQGTIGGYADTGKDLVFDVVKAAPAQTPTAQVISAEWVKKGAETSVLINEEFTVKVVTTADVTKVSLKNETGGSIGQISKTTAINGEGKKVWLITIKIGTSGNPRAITASGYSPTEGDLNGQSFQIVITK